MSLLSLAKQAQLLSPRYNQQKSRCCRLSPAVWFAEKILASRDELRRLQAAAKRRQEEQELASVVEECQNLVRATLLLSMQAARGKIPALTIELLTGKEVFSDSLLKRRLISQQEICQKLREAGFQIGQKYNIPAEVLTEALVAAASVTDLFPSTAGSVIDQQRITVGVTSAAYAAAEMACETSLDALQPHWIVKKALTRFDLAARLLRAADCHPEDQRIRGADQIAKCLQGFLANVYFQISRRSEKRVASLLYSLYRPSVELPHQRLYLVHGRTREA